jgi:hypothetical protein
MCAQILSIAPSPPDSAEEVARQDDQRVLLQGIEAQRLAPARGIALGLLLSVMIWLVVGSVAYFIF